MATKNKASSATKKQGKKKDRVRKKVEVEEETTKPKRRRVQKEKKEKKEKTEKKEKKKRKKEKKEDAEKEPEKSEEHEKNEGGGCCAATEAPQRQGWELSDFTRRVYAYTKRIPQGKVATYKDIALAVVASTGARVEGGTAHRAVGNALKKNPFAPMVPCHRVVKSDYTIGGFLGNQGRDNPHVIRKIQTLEAEGVTFNGLKVGFGGRATLAEVIRNRPLNPDELTDRALGERFKEDDDDDVMEEADGMEDVDGQDEASK